MATAAETSTRGGAASAYAPPTRAWALRRAARVLAAGAQERLRRAPAQSAADVPRSPDEITAEWLTRVLCAATPGAQVQRVAVPGGSIGTTTRKALHVTYNDAGTRAELPTRLFVKCTTALAQRLILGLGGFIDGEAGFFTHVRPHLAIEAPRGYHARVDSRSWRSVTVM